MIMIDLEALENEVESRLDSELDFDLDFETNSYYEDKTYIVDVNINMEDNDYPEDFDEDVENIISDIVEEWGGWYSWDGWCISISIPDED